MNKPKNTEFNWFIAKSNELIPCLVDTEYFELCEVFSEINVLIFLCTEKLALYVPLSQIHAAVGKDSTTE